MAMDTLVFRLATLDGAFLPTKHGHAGSALSGAILEYQSDSSSKQPDRPCRPPSRSEERTDTIQASTTSRTSSLDKGHSISALIRHRKSALRY